MSARAKRLADMERHALLAEVHALPDDVLETLSLEFQQADPEEWAAAQTLLSAATDDELERASLGIPMPPTVLDRLDVDNAERARLLTLLTERGWLR
jgi:hypothetical protein